MANSGRVGVPLFPGGWGVRETAFLVGFQAVGVPDEDRGKIVILSVLLGLSLMAWSLIGGFFLFGGRRGGEVIDPEALAATETT